MTFRKLVDLESLLPALLQIYQKYNTSTALSGEQIERELRWLAHNGDPTGEKAVYMRWLVPLEASGVLNGYDAVDTARSLLSDYDRLKKIPKTKGLLSRDIADYKTPEALENAVHPLLGIISKKRGKRDTVEGVLTNLKDYGTVEKVDGYTFLYVKNPSDVCDFVNYLEITSWCIKAESYAEDYAPVIFIIDSHGRVIANCESNEGMMYDRRNRTFSKREIDSALEKTSFYSNYLNAVEDNEYKREEEEEREEEGQNQTRREEAMEDWDNNKRDEFFEILGLPAPEQWQKELANDIMFGYVHGMNFGYYYTIDMEYGEFNLIEENIIEDAEKIKHYIFNRPHPDQMELFESLRLALGGYRKMK